MIPEQTIALYLLLTGIMAAIVVLLMLVRWLCG